MIMNKIYMFLERLKLIKKQINRYLTSPIPNREMFLKRTRLTSEKLPILSIYLGNDCIGRVSDVPQFVKYLKLRHGNFVISIINWLAVNSVNEAVKKMLDYFEDESAKKRLKTLIDEMINQYTCKESPYLKYFKPFLSTKHKETDDNDSESSLYWKNVSEMFIDKYRKGFYHHHSLDILFYNKYYPKPLVENINKNHSYKLTFPIISAVYNILTDNSTNDLLIYVRVGKDISEQIIPKCKMELPNYEQLQEMNNQDKLLYFFKIIDIENEFLKNCLELFPESWHLLLITLKYMSKVTHIEWSLIYVLVISKIILSYVDGKLGHIRSWKELDRCASKYSHEADKKEFTEFSPVSQAIED